MTGIDTVEKNSGFNSILGFGNQAFTVIILLLVAGISAHISYGYSTKRARELFIALILILIVGCQFYHLIFAALYVPATQFHIFNPRFHRSDCINGSKGGKTPMGSTKSYDINQCFVQCNNWGGTCSLISSGSTVSGDCPTDGSAKCLDGDDEWVDLYNNPLRDCYGGQGNACTRDQPCTPCERDTLYYWSSNKGNNNNRCRTCSTDFKGDCHFIPNVGPYCYKSKDSKEVVPCKKCCTEAAYVVVNGKCY